MFHVKPLLGRRFTINIKPFFLRKIKVKKTTNIKVSSAAILLGSLRVNVTTSVLHFLLSEV